MKLLSNLKVLALFVIQTLIIVLLGLFSAKTNMDFSKTAMILSCGVVLSVHLLVYTLSNYKVASMVGANFFGLLIVVNYFKVKIRNTPLIFSDVKLINEMANVKNLFSFREVAGLIIGMMIINVVLFLIFNYVYKKIKVEKSELRRYLFALALLPAILISYFGIQHTTYNYDRGGVFYHVVNSFSNKANNVKFTKEEKSILTELVDDLVPSTADLDKANTDETSNTQPNIIIIMNEAYWDVNLLEKAKLTPDPMAAFYKIAEEGISGNLQVPVFGGGTSNTEFEVLTGYSTHIYDGGYMMYTNEVTKPFMSLASVLKTQGYNTSGLHAFWGWYYNRNDVYKHLGFDKFIVDEFMNKSDLKGYYISDDSTINEIVDEIEDSEKPSFIYCVTMENHGPYDDKRFDKFKFDVEIESDLPEDTQELIKVYGQGIYDASKSLEKLVDYLRTSDEETVVVFFGDHLPLLGADLKAYKENEFISEDQSFVEKAVKLSSVPFVIWSNYKEDVKKLGTIDTTFLGPYVLDYAGAQMPNYYKHLLKMYDSVDFVSDRMIQDKEGNIYLSETDQYKALETPMRIVQKDMLYGSQNIEPDKDKWVDYSNKDYNKALTEIKITNVIVEADRLTITGENMYEKGILVINGIEHEFVFDNDQRLIVDHVDTKPKNGLIHVSMTLKNTIDKVIAQSNDYTKNVNE